MKTDAVKLPWFISTPRRALESYLSQSNYLVLDLETNNKDFGSAVNPLNHIVLSCWLVVKDGVITKKEHWGDEYSLSVLEKDIKQADFVVAHNAKFELQWLKRCGMELRDILVFDTMLAEWVISGNRGLPLNLEETAARYGLGAKLSLSSKAIGLGMDPEQLPKEWLLPYCHMDVALCHALYLRQIEVLERDDLLHLTLTRNLACAALADIEFNPCELDKERVIAEYTATLDRFHELEEQLAKLTGGINLSSPKQLGTYLYDVLGFVVPRDHKGNKLETKTGAPKTDNNTLALLSATTQEQGTFLTLYKERNRCDSLLTKNLEFFKLICEQRDGKFYGSFNQGFAATHRLTSSGKSILFKGAKRPKGVQLQNLPRQYKGLFTAHAVDELVLEFDGSQLEFRVATDLGRDPVGQAEIIAGEDVHSVSASVLTNAGQPTTRQEAKSRTFAPLFGGMGKTKPEKAYSEFFKKKYVGITSTQDGWCHQVLNTGRQINPYGMRFYWPGTKMNARGYIDNSTSIKNYSIQSFATGEIIPIALVYFWHRTRDKAITIFNTIHDSVAVRVHVDLVEECKAIAKQSMTYDVYEYLHNVYEYDFDWVPLGL
jgi:DNA polymerase I-like protein with 3'-5' exonuclease and polymerase domains